MVPLRNLQAMGVHIACDNFGAAYSSFSYLRDLVFDRNRVDNSFIREVANNLKTLRIVQAILVTTRSLGITVPAEGVETERHFARPRERRSGEVQAFLLGRSVLYEEVASYLQKTSDDRIVLQVNA